MAHPTPAPFLNLKAYNGTVQQKSCRQGILIPTHRWYNPTKKTNSRDLAPAFWRLCVSYAPAFTHTVGRYLAGASSNSWFPGTGLRSNAQYQHKQRFTYGVFLYDIYVGIERFWWCFWRKDNGPSPIHQLYYFVLFFLLFVPPDSDPSPSLDPSTHS